MSEAKKPKWKPVTVEQDTFRLDVPGGWIYSITTNGQESAVFVPKPPLPKPPLPKPPPKPASIDIPVRLLSESEGG